MSSIKEIAEGVTAKHFGPRGTQLTGGIYERLIADIEQALRDRDERAAKIADERAAFNTRMRDRYRLENPRLADFKELRREEASVIASEIRRDDDPREEEELLRQTAMEDDARDEQEINQ